MPTVRYEAPSSVGDAVRLMQADPERERSSPAAPTCWSSSAPACASRARSSTSSGFPSSSASRSRADGLRIGAPPRRPRSASTPTVGQLWPGLVEAVHLIGSTQIQGRGTRRRQSVQRARRRPTRTCALIVNRARVRHRRPGRRAQRRRRSSSAWRPGKTVLAPGELLVALRRAAAGAAHGGRLSAADSALRNGHRGRRRRGQRDARRERRLHRGARRDRRRRADGAARGRRGARRSSARTLDDGRARTGGRGGQRRRAADRRQARHRRLPPRRSPACSPSARRASRLPRARKEADVSKLHVETTINGEPAEFLCDGRRNAARPRCATGSA